MKVLLPRLAPEIAFWHELCMHFFLIVGNECGMSLVMLMNDEASLSDPLKDLLETMPKILLSFLTRKQFRVFLKALEFATGWAEELFNILWTLISFYQAEPLN